MIKGDNSGMHLFNCLLSSIILLHPFNNMIKGYNSLMLLFNCFLSRCREKILFIPSL
jgi:hypothetical protein